MLVIAVFAGIFVASKTFGSVALSNLSDAVCAFSNGMGSNASFPLDTAADSIKAMGDGLLIINHDSLQTVNSNAAGLLSVKLKYSDAAAEMQNGRAIVFDRNATGFMVLGKTKLLSESETKQPMLTAAISKNGYIAVATLSSGEATSEVTVYDRSMKEYFKWECATAYISDISFSPSGKNIAVVALGVKDAEIFSKLRVFSIKKPEPLASFDFDGTTVIDVKYTAKNRIAVLGDNLHTVISDKFERTQDTVLDSDTVACFDSADNGKSAVVLLKYGNENGAVLSVFARDGSKSFDKKIVGKVTDVACSGSYTAVLCKDSLHIFDNLGSETSVTKLSDVAYEVALTDRAAYVRFADKIEKYGVH